MLRHQAGEGGVTPKIRLCKRTHHIRLRSSADLRVELTLSRPVDVLVIIGIVSNVVWHAFASKLARELLSAWGPCALSGHTVPWAEWAADGSGDEQRTRSIRNVKNNGRSTRTLSKWLQLRRCRQFLSRFPCVVPAIRHWAPARPAQCQNSATHFFGY